MKNSSQSSQLLVLPWSPSLPGGVSVVVRHIQYEMLKKGYHPIIVINNWNAGNAIFDHEGILNFRFGIIGEISLIALFKSFINFPLRLLKTLKLLQRYNVQSVNFHYPSTDALVIAILKRLRIYNGSLVLSFHGTDVQSPSNPFAQKIWEIIWNTIDGASACSLSLANQACTAFGRDIKQFSVIYNGVDTTVFSPAAELHLDCLKNLPKKYIVSIGSYIPRKGHAILLDAISCISSEFPELALVIVGMDGSERQLLIEQAARLRIGDRLTCMVGLAPGEVASVTTKATLCVQPSRAEPFGLAVIEAGACGVPVVASAVGGHLELIDHMKTGFLFTSEDHNHCALILRELLINPEIGLKAAETFRKKILERYTWDACAQNYINLMNLEIRHNST